MIPSSFQFNQVVLGQAQETLNQNSIVELKAEKVGESYVWKSNELGLNPLLNLKSNEAYTFLITSFQNDAKHKLMIEPREGGEHLAESEEIEHGSSAQVTFNTGIPQTLKYYCEYHPQSMAGLINVIAVT